MTNSATPNFTDEEVGNILRMKEKIQDLIKMHGIFETVDIDKEGEFVTKPLTGGANQLVIAGGVFTSLFHDEPIKDVDVFILKPGINPEITLLNQVMRYKEGNWNIKYRFNEEDDYYNPHIFGVADHVESKVQYVLTDHTNRQDLLKDFDFLHSTVSYHEGKLHINRETYDAIANKKLISQNLKKEPKKTRVLKFLNKGFAKAGEEVSQTKTKALLKLWEASLKEAAEAAEAAATVRSPWSAGGAYHRQPIPSIIESTNRPKRRIDQATDTASQWKAIFDDTFERQIDKAINNQATNNHTTIFDSQEVLEWQKNKTPFSFDMTIRDKTKIV